jgi:hypothetical protein
MPTKILFTLSASATLGAAVVAANVAPRATTRSSFRSPARPWRRRSSSRLGPGALRPGLGAGGTPSGAGRAAPCRWGSKRSGWLQPIATPNHSYRGNSHGNYSCGHRGSRYPNGVCVYGNSSASNHCYYTYSKKKRRRILVCDE